MQKRKFSTFKNKRVTAQIYIRKMMIMNSKRRPGIRKSYMDEVVKRGTASRDRHKASTWGSVGAFFRNQSGAHAPDVRYLDTHQYD